MNRFIWIASVLVALQSNHCFAQESADGFSSVTVRDVTSEYELSQPSPIGTPIPMSTPIPKEPSGPLPGGINPTPTPGNDTNIPPLPNPFPTPSGPVNADTIISIGSKIWDFIVNNKPTADYKTLKASVVPSGITDWAQLTGWSKDKYIVKIYRVEFKNTFGKVGGSFDYRMSFFYGGSYKGKGKYIGQIAIVPGNIKLHTDRSITFRAELLDALNFGTEENPIAGVQLQVTWSSPTTTRYEMHSAEYFMLATGEIQDITNGQ